MTSSQTKLANAAIYYAAEGYSTGGERIMGRQAAGEGFLKGFATSAQVDSFYAYTSSEKEFGYFAKQIRSWSGKANQSCTQVVANKHDALEKVGCLYYPAPGVGEMAWARRIHSAKAYSICGITHTTASETVMSHLARLLVDPVEEWDALICTSVSVRKMIEVILDDYGQYLEQRTGSKPKLNMQLPVIPLGVNVADFQIKKDHWRAHFRQQLKIGESDIMVLFMGRLSYHAKAHPMPMLLALQNVAKQTGQKIHLVQAGWFPNDAIANSFKDAANDFAPDVICHYLDGRAPDVRQGIWHAADIFTSLSDNIQETFGLVPIEAMAAGLPIVITDWDGYRELARHGVDGFLIPTLFPSQGSLDHIARAHAEKNISYDRYIGYSSQVVGVDVRACTDAFMALVTDANLRKKMGQSGLERAKQVFDWPVIVRRYQELWYELGQRRTQGDTAYPIVSGGASKWPFHNDPTVLFENYPTQVLSPDEEFTITSKDFAAEFAKFRGHIINEFAKTIFLDDADCQILIRAMLKTPSFKVDDLLKLFEGYKKRRAHLTIAWCYKMGLIGYEHVPFKEGPVHG